MFRNRQSLGAVLVVVTLISVGAIAMARDPQSATRAVPSTATPATPAVVVAPAATAAAAPATAPDCRTVVFSITCGPDSIFELVTAFHVAEDALAAGNHVVLFFNGRGVNVPLKKFQYVQQDLQLGRERSLWRMLQDLIGAGAEVVVARESTRVLELSDREFIVGTQFGHWGGSIFNKMPKNSVVFSY